MSEKLNLSAEETADLLGVSLPHVYSHLVHRPDFPAYRIGNRWLIPRALLEKWNNEQALNKEGRREHE